MAFTSKQIISILTAIYVALYAIVLYLIYCLRKSIVKNDFATFKSYFDYYETIITIVSILSYVFYVFQINNSQYSSVRGVNIALIIVLYSFVRTTRSAVYDYEQAMGQLYEIPSMKYIEAKFYLVENLSYMLVLFNSVSMAVM